MPDASNARPAGLYKPVLTKVDTTPAGVTLLMLLSLLLATYRLPEASKARPSGAFKPALTKMNTTPKGVIFLILLSILETYRLPDASKARPKGLVNPAALEFTKVETVCAFIKEVEIVNTTIKESNLSFIYGRFNDSKVYT